MPLNANRLGTQIANALLASRPAAGAELSDADLEAIWQQIATRIVSEITANAQVSVTVQTSDGPAPGTGTVT